MARSDSKSSARREDIANEGSDGIGGIVDELTSGWLVGDALTRIVDAGEKVVHAQQSALSALGLPSGSQFESLTLRVRTIFHRLEELEDDIDRLEQRLNDLDRKSAAASPAKRAAPRTKSKPKAKPRTAAAKSSK